MYGKLTWLVLGEDPAARSHRVEQCTYTGCGWFILSGFTGPSSGSLEPGLGLDACVIFVFPVSLFLSKLRL